MTSETERFTDQDAAAIRTLTETHLRAVMDHDPDAFLATCADDIALLPPEEPALQGREACRAYLENFPTPTTFTNEFDDIDGEGNLAFSRGRASAEFEDGATTFKWVAIHRRQPDGTWKMVRDIWNN